MGNETRNWAKGRLNLIFEIRDLQNLKIIWEAFGRWKSSQLNWHQTQKDSLISNPWTCSTTTSNKGKKSKNKESHRWNLRGSSIKKHIKGFLWTTHEINSLKVCRIHELKQKK